VREFHIHRTALVDADYLCYEAAAWALSTQADFDDLHERLTNTIRRWVEQACCSDWIVLYSCEREDNFRRDHYPLYKAHRSGSAPPMLEDAKQVIRSMGKKSIARPRIEADDLMGILASNGKVENPVIITRDKDLRQIPGWHFNPYAEDFPVFVGQHDADRLFYSQWLTGDQTDGFGGIKGVGPAKAAKLLEGLCSGVQSELAVMDAYREAGYTWQECLAQARCARILRSEDWDATRQEPIPWEPYPAAWRAAWEDGEDGEDG
jgi:5'-3' exonuclease